MRGYLSARTEARAVKFENRYTWSSRLLHRLAFKSAGIQVALADVERRLFAGKLDEVSVDRPVIVTALPRAGTTILLELLVRSGAFVSHTYRDMPFVLCPLLWQSLTARFQTQDEARERAHGDGLTVSYDSPEAFEEVVWKHFWPAHYEPDRIEPWQSCDDPEFVEFFCSHVQRIVAIRNPAARYVSKNNLNIARLACLPHLLPDARIIVPFRDPLQHAASLLRQHQMFLQTHRSDPFASEYMEGIGHYDFGLNLRPVNFDGWLEADRRKDASELPFWVEYWIAAYKHILDHERAQIFLLPYHSLSTDPRSVLAAIARFVELEAPERLIDQWPQLRAPRRHDVDASNIPYRLLEDSKDVHAALHARAGVQLSNATA